jgi:hypothetical protein
MNRPDMHNPDPDAADHPPAGREQVNLSTEHQRNGDAKRPSDTLDRDQDPPQDDGGRKSSFLHND